MGLRIPAEYEFGLRIVEGDGGLLVTRGGRNDESTKKTVGLRKAEK